MDKNCRNLSTITNKKSAKKLEFINIQLLNSVGATDPSDDNHFVECDAYEVSLYTFCLGIESSLEEYTCKFCA